MPNRLDRSRLSMAARGAISPIREKLDPIPTPPKKDKPEHKNGTKNPLATREDRISERRQKVRYLKEKGFNQREIARAIDVHRNTVASDLKFLADENRRKAVEIEAYQELGSHISELENLQRKAKEILDTSKDPAMQLKILEFIRKTRGDHIQLQVKAGILPESGAEAESEAMDRVKHASDKELEDFEAELLKELQGEK